MGPSFGGRQEDLKRVRILMSIPVSFHWARSTFWWTDSQAPQDRKVSGWVLLGDKLRCDQIRVNGSNECPGRSMTFCLLFNHLSILIVQIIKHGHPRNLSLQRLIYCSKHFASKEGREKVKSDVVCSCFTASFLSFSSSSPSPSSSRPCSSCSPPLLPLLLLFSIVPNNVLFPNLKSRHYPQPEKTERLIISETNVYHTFLVDLVISLAINVSLLVLSLDIGRRLSFLG